MLLIGKKALEEASNVDQQKLINIIADKLIRYPQISMSDRPLYIDEIIAQIEERPFVDNSHIERVRQKTESEINNLHNEQYNLAKQNDRLKNEYNTLLSQYSEIQLKQAELEAQVISLSSEKTRVEEEIKALRIEPTKLTTRKNKLSKEIDVLEEKEKVTLTKINVLEEELSKLNELVKRKTHIELEISDLYSKIDNLKYEIETVSPKIKQIQIQISELNSVPSFTRGDGWQEQEKLLKDEEKELNKRKVAFEDEIEHLREELKLCQHQRNEIDQLILSKRG